MGQKIHPEGFRVGYIHDWKSNWFEEKNFADRLQEDLQIRDHIENKLSHAGLSSITIERRGEVAVDIHTARPGIVIGKSGSEVDALRKELHKLTGSPVKVNIREVKRPELDAKLVAQSIAEQLQNRVAFRRAMKRALTSAMRSGAKGVKVQVSGRLGGAEMARTESYSDGRVPLHTLRADIDYGFFEARTTTGRIGVKCWINKGEVMPEGFRSDMVNPDEAPAGRAPAAVVTAIAIAVAVATVIAVDAVRAAAVVDPAAAVVAVAPAAVAVPVAAAWWAVPAAAWTGGGGGGRGPGGPAAVVDPVVAVAAVVAPVGPAAVVARWWQSWTRWRWSLMLMPKRVKHRKQFRGRMRGDTKGGSTVAFGEYGLKAVERGWLTNRQIEAARVAMTRKIKRGGKVWINVFPDKPYTKKPAETRMGSGKGNPEGWVAVVKPGKVMFELAGVPEELAREALRLAGHKLPVKTKFVKREGAGAVKSAEVHNLKDDELVVKLIDAKEEAFNLRFRHATGELENTARLGQAKRDVARLITVARERGIDVEKETRRI